MPSAPLSGASSSALATGGNEAYGICQVSGAVGKDVSLPIGYDLTPSAPFDSVCSAVSTGQSVGTLTTDANIIGTGPGEVQDGWAKWLVKASITSTTPPMPDLTDTITFVVTATY